MKKNKERGPFDSALPIDRVLSLVALAVGAACLALHESPAMVGVGLLALAMGCLGLAFGTW
ncbi:MAG: hypothetical protein LUE89_10905 [Clostridiales bacterium]|nr:hypothetical protein [Clostridiales bacterium]